MPSDSSLPILSNPLPTPPAWEALFATLTDGVCVQTLDARIVQANQSFADMLGLPLEKIIGHTCAEVFGCANETGQIPHFCARAASANSSQVESEEIGGRQPGQLLRASVSPVRDAQGIVIAYVMVARDVTDVVAREREQARVEQLARFGELAAGLAHEIKNPLAGIQGAVDILIQRREANDPERTVLENVRREVERINNTVHQLLQRARPRVLNVRPASINDTARQAVNLARAGLTGERRHRICIEFIPAPEPPVLPIDGAQLEDAILNLILNAVEAIEHEGAVTVRVNHDHDDGHVVIEVTDTGRGIAAEDLQRIFSPFYTTQPNGTGLGLPAVRRIARAHGGRVDVTSTVGNGSTFVIRLPRASSPQ
jgi:PAS domain S-box-containing protein